MKIILKKFDELSPLELYHSLRLRAEIFVLEQDCRYQDIDERDQKALHVLGMDQNKIIAYGRCFGPGTYFEEAAIGRIAVARDERKSGYGHEIVQACISAIETEFNTSVIRLSAQQYLIGFYESHGFKTIGNGYFEDGIPHIAMLKSGE